MPVACVLLVLLAGGLVTLLVARMPIWAEKPAAAKAPIVRGAEPRHEGWQAERTTEREPQTRGTGDGGPTKPTNPETPVNLVRLMRDKLVDAEVVYQTANLVSLKVAPRTGSPREMVVPAGTILRASEPVYQDLVVIENVLIPLEESASVLIRTCCIDQRKAPPVPIGKGLTYSIEELPESSKLRRLAEELAKSEMTMSEKQDAVWRFPESRP